MLTSFKKLTEWVDINSNHYYFRCYTNEIELTATIGQDSRYLDHEFDMFKEFALRTVNALGTKLFLELIEIGQHFGLPTRLIDFTVDPYVALYFGLGTKNRSQFYLCYMDKNIIPEVLNDYFTTIKDVRDLTIQIKEIRNTSIANVFQLKDNSSICSDYLNSSLFRKQYVEYFNNQGDYTLRRFNPCETNNPRLMAQKGLFIAMQDPAKPLPEKLFEEIKIELSDNDKKSLEELLNKNGYTKDNLLVEKIDSYTVAEWCEEIKGQYLT